MSIFEQKNKILKQGKPLIYILVSSHTLCTCDKAFLLAKKKNVFLFYIYNFYFENLLYKWIKQFKINRRVTVFFRQCFNGS